MKKVIVALILFSLSCKKEKDNCIWTVETYYPDDSFGLFSTKQECETVTGYPCSMVDGKFYPKRPSFSSKQKCETETGYPCYLTGNGDYYKSKQECEQQSGNTCYLQCPP